MNNTIKNKVANQMSTIPSLPITSSEYICKLLTEDSKKRQSLFSQIGMNAYLVRNKKISLFSLTISLLIVYLFYNYIFY